MNTKIIQEIVDILEQSSLTHLTVKDGEYELALKKEVNNNGIVAMQQSITPGIVSATEQLANLEEKEEEEILFITSPIVGTFYAAAAPELPAFVKVGDIVREGETVCIMEAMKLMNEIESQYDCEIEAVMVSNEQKVGYGQPLFRVKRI
ncbi:MAG: acetyl-CoA carboxylase biotin carboxyl carrier protein [Eubacteriales bacterium]